MGAAAVLEQRDLAVGLPAHPFGLVEVGDHLAERAGGLGARSLPRLAGGLAAVAEDRDRETAASSASRMSGR
jgi:hypothetical protein